MQVAVAQVAEVDQAHARNLAHHHGVGIFDKRRNARNGHRDVVLDVEPFFRLCQRNVLADMPQVVRLREVFCHDGVGYAAGLESGFEQRLKACAGVVFGFAVGIFEQHAIGHVVLLDEGHAQLRHVLVHQAQGKAAHHFKAGEPRAQVLVRQAQQRHGMFHGGHGGPGGELRCGLGVQLERGGGDDAQRAFAANEQVAQVVARVVLAQALEAVPHLALRRDHFEAHAQVAGVAIAHHLRAARIGAQVAADGAAALGRQRKGKQQARLVGCILHVLQNAAGIHRHGEVVLVEGAHGVHARKAQHHLRARGVGCRAHGQAGVAALGHDGCARGGAGTHHGCHFVGTAGAHHGQRFAALAAAPVLLPGTEIALGQDMGGAHNALQGVDQSGHTGLSGNQ